MDYVSQKHALFNVGQKENENYIQLYIWMSFKNVKCAIIHNVHKYLNKLRAHIY